MYAGGIKLMTDGSCVPALAEDIRIISLREDVRWDVPLGGKGRVYMVNFGV